MEEYARGLVTGGTLFDELGFFYVGPIDGQSRKRSRLSAAICAAKQPGSAARSVIHTVTHYRSTACPRSILANTRWTIGRCASDALNGVRH
jgi:hypothetical protein